MKNLADLGTMLGLGATLNRTLGQSGDATPKQVADIVGALVAAVEHDGASPAALDGVMQVLGLLSLD